MLQNKWLSFIGITLLSFGCYLDYTVVNIALPTIQNELQTSLTSLQWVMNIYFLALCIFAAIFGRCGDLYGRRLCFYIGVFIFLIASLIAGFSPNIDWLIFGRLLQGMGAAFVFPLGPSLLPQSFPEEERGKAIAWLGSMGGIALTLGPILGGFIVTHWGWRWIFFINVPIIFLGYFVCMLCIKESVVEQDNTRLDWKGMVLLALTMGGLVMGLIQGEHYGWNIAYPWIYLFSGIVAFTLLFKIEKEQENPLINFKDFSNVLFHGGAVLCFLSGTLSAVALFFDPLYLQIIRGQSPQFSGLVLFAIPIAVFIVAFLVGQLIHQFGILNSIILGLIFAALSGFLQIFFSLTTSIIYIVFAFMILGSTWAMGNTVSIIAGQAAVEPRRRSVATGTIVTMFNIGGSIGLTIAVVIYNFVTSNALQNIFFNDGKELSLAQQSLLQKLIANPTHTLEVSLPTDIHHYFNEAFMRGFSGVMWFLFVISSLALISVLVRRHKY